MSIESFEDIHMPVNLLYPYFKDDLFAALFGGSAAAHTIDEAGIMLTMGADITFVPRIVFDRIK